MGTVLVGIVKAHAILLLSPLGCSGISGFSDISPHLSLTRERQVHR